MSTTERVTVPFLRPAGRPSPPAPGSAVPGRAPATVWIAFLALALLPACPRGTGTSASVEVPAGGPCSYTTRSTPARVTELTDLGDGRFEVMFEVGEGDETETQAFSWVKNRMASREEVEKAGVAVGRVFTFDRLTIASGACSPDLTDIRLVPWTSAPPAAAP